MAGNKGVQIEGLRELTKALNQLGDDAKNDIKSVHADAAKDVKQAAARKAPVRSGRLRSSLRSSGTKRDGRVKAGSARVPYAGPIHFGWRKRNITPQPFLYDALDDRRDAVVKRYESEINKLIRKHDLS